MLTNEMEIADKEKEFVPGSNEEADEDDLSDVEEGETKCAKLRKRKIWSGLSDQEFSEKEIFLESNSDQDSEEEVLSWFSFSWS